MKKALKILCAVPVAACMCLAAVACGGNKGNNGNGGATVDVVAISQDEYATAENALKAYVGEQLAYSRRYTVDDWDGIGHVETEKTEEVVSAQYVSHTNKSNMKPADVKLDDTTDIKSVSKIELKARLALVEDVEEPEYEDVTQTVYLLGYGDAKYKYMVSTPVIGERLTNSYIEAVTDHAKYANCTISAVSTERQTGEDKPSFANAYEYRFAGNALAQIYYRDEGRYNSRTPGGTADSHDEEYYLVATDDGLKGVYKNYNDNENTFEWATDDVDDYSTVAEALQDIVGEEILGFYEYMPAALFKKTATGFEYKTDVTDTTEHGDERTVSQYLFTVTGGKITAMDMSMSQTGTDEDGEFDRYMAQNSAFTAFGSTAVTPPADALQ